MDEMLFTQEKKTRGKNENYLHLTAKNSVILQCGDLHQEETSPRPGLLCPQALVLDGAWNRRLSSQHIEIASTEMLFSFHGKIIAEISIWFSAFQKKVSIYCNK